MFVTLQAGPVMHRKGDSCKVGSLSILEAMEGPFAVDIATIRPGTAAYADRHQAAAFRDEAFRPTASASIRLRVLNLEGGFYELGVIDEMLMPVARGIPSGAFGNMSVVVVTSDESLADYVRYLASSQQAPLWISDSLDQFWRRAEPAWNLTSAEDESLGAAQRIGGRVTASQLAGHLGIEANAAANRLAALERKGYVFRQARSKREGDLFVVPVQPQNLWAHSTSPTLTFDVPDEIRADVTRLAAEQGKTTQELLAEAWRNYAKENEDALRAHRRTMRDLLEAGDEEGFLAATSENNDDSADRR